MFSYLLVESMSESADESRLELPISLSASRIYLSDIRAHFRLHIVQPLRQLPGLEETVKGIQYIYALYAGKSIFRKKAGAGRVTWFGVGTHQ
jgi:hypothetical protein